MFVLSDNLPAKLPQDSKSTSGVGKRRPPDQSGVPSAAHSVASSSRDLPVAMETEAPIGGDSVDVKQKQQQRNQQQQDQQQQQQQDQQQQQPSPAPPRPPKRKRPRRMGPSMPTPSSAFFSDKKDEAPTRDLDNQVSVWLLCS